jgi:predicted ATPase
MPTCIASCGSKSEGLRDALWSWRYSGCKCMLTRLLLENFKSFHKLELEPTRITILIGPNNSGKSSVLQALAFLKQSVIANHISFADNLVNLGQFWDVVTQHDVDREIKIGLVGKSPVELRVKEMLGVSYDDVQYEYSIGVRENEVTRNAASVEWGPFSVSASTVRRTVEGTGAQPAKFDFGGLSCNFRYDNFWDPIGFGLSAPPQADRELAARVSDSLRSLLSSPIRCIQRLYRIPAGRLIDRPSLNLVDKYSTDLSVSGDLSQQADTVASNLAYRRELEDRISSWLARLTGVSVISRPSPGKRVMVETVTPSIRVNVVNDGSGTNQLVHLLLQMALAPSGSTLMIEEPELHLHPRAQAELAGILVEIAKQTQKQVILTTHSEHILFRALNELTEKKLSSSDLSVYYFLNKDGSGSAQRLVLDEKGMIKGGLPGFLETEVDELSRYLKAVGSVDPREENVRNR